MQKRASIENNNRYPIVFQHIPAASEALIYFDEGTVEIPYSEDFPKLHYHDKYEIGLCLKGDGLFLSDGSFMTVTEGDYIFVPPGQPHYSRSLDASAPCVCVFAYVKEDSVREALSVFGDRAKDGALSHSLRYPHIISAKEHPFAAELLSGIVKLENRASSTRGQRAVMRLALFILEGEEHFGMTDRIKVVHRSDSAAKVAEYIALRYSESHTTEELAAICHLSESQLRRRFISAYGMPPIAYRNSLRAGIATELLLRTEFSVAEISAKLGFNSTSDFYRAFKKQYGQSPSEYRKHKAH